MKYPPKFDEKHDRDDAIELCEKMIKRYLDTVMFDKSPTEDTIKESKLPMYYKDNKTFNEKYGIVEPNIKDKPYNINSFE